MKPIGASAPSWSRMPPAAARWLRREFIELLPVVGFFLIGFLIVLLIVKLVLAQYAIAISALSRAVFGALIAGKVVLVLERTSLARGFKAYPRIIAVMVKTVFYGLAVMVLGIADRVLHEWRHGAGFVSALHALSAYGMHRLLAVALAVSMVFAVYFVLAEISATVGREQLFALFFKRPLSQR
ncbi:MAG: hypothetical protein ACREQX_19560 [Candidatus Binataceae bacterium]